MLARLDGLIRLTKFLLYGYTTDTQNDGTKGLETLDRLNAWFILLSTPRANTEKTAEDYHYIVDKLPVHSW